MKLNMLYANVNECMRSAESAANEHLYHLGRLESLAQTKAEKKAIYHTMDMALRVTEKLGKIRIPIRRADASRKEGK